MKIQITNTAWVNVTKHENGFYTQLVYNGGHNAGKIYISKTEKVAMNRAEKLKSNY